MRWPAPASPLQADDAAIIEESAADPERFAALFDRHAPVIHRYVARRAGREVADDLVAETFLAAFSRRARYNPAYRDARPWLYGIATNLIGQHRRAEARQLRLLLAVPPEPDHPGHDDRVAGVLTARAARSALAAALGQLPDAERDVLLLIAWEQLSYEEVSQAMEIPVGTVRSRLSRARSRLRATLAKTDLSATFGEILRNE